MQQVECRQIRHSYDGVRDAVTELDLIVKRGEVLALIGPNGAGATSSGTAPTRGAIDSRSVGASASSAMALRSIPA